MSLTRPGTAYHLLSPGQTPLTHSLDDLLAHPERVQELPPETAVDLLARLVPLQTVLLSRVLSSSAKTPEASSPEDRLLTVEEAARIARVSKRWLYARASNLPFTRKLSHKVVRFSEAGLRKWLAMRRV